MSSSMNEYINLEDAIRLFKRKSTHVQHFYQGDDAIKMLERLPVIEINEGEWINKHKWENGFFERECSVCGAMKPILMHTAKIHFCPNCGAKMKG